VTASEAGQELGPYTEVADTLIFAAVERAVLHEQEDEVLLVVSAPKSRRREADEHPAVVTPLQPRCSRRRSVSASALIPGPESHVHRASWRVFSARSAASPNSRNSDVAR
jgi:hypothetical protein